MRRLRSVTTIIRLEVKRVGLERALTVELLTAASIVLLGFLARALASQL